MSASTEWPVAASVLGGWLGAAPGIVLVVHILRQHWKRQRRATLPAADAPECAEPHHDPAGRFDLWRRPHCFVQRLDAPAIAAAKHETPASRATLLRNVLGGSVLAVAGGTLGVFIGCAIA